MAAPKAVCMHYLTIDNPTQVPATILTSQTKKVRHRRLLSVPKLPQLEPARRWEDIGRVGVWGVGGGVETAVKKHKTKQPDCEGPHTLHEGLVTLQTRKGFKEATPELMEAPESL